MAIIVSYIQGILIDAKTQRSVMRHGVTKVYFANATDAEITSYVESGSLYAVQDVLRWKNWVDY